MTNDQNPDMDEIKERIEIPVEEDIDGMKADAKAESEDVVAELKGLGKQFADAVQTAWNSEERARFEQDIRKGVDSFVSEVDKAIRDAKSTDAAGKVRTEAERLKVDVEGSDISQKARSGLVQGLHWLSDELGKLADQFTPADEPEAPSAEKGPEDIDDGSAE